MFCAHLSRSIRRTALRRVFWPGREHRERRAAVRAAGRGHRRVMRQSDAVAALAGWERSKGPAGGVVRRERRAVWAESSRRVADPELESLRAAVFGMAAEGVATREAMAAEGALVVAGFEVDLAEAN